ncbi:MAG: BACON domain-containing protein, partial [Phycisphaerales bacterium]
GGEGVGVEFVLDTSSCQWLAVSDQEWIRIHPELSVVAGGWVAVDFSIDPIDGDAPLRRGHVHIFTADGGRLSVPITQGACEPTESPDADARRIVQAKGAPATRQTVPVASAFGGCEWEASSDVDWIEVLVDVGAADPRAAEVVFSVKANRSGRERTGSIQVIWDSGEVQQIDIVQPPDLVKPDQRTVPVGQSRGGR